MPPRYEAMRDTFAQDMPLSAAKGKAARIFNATRGEGEAPVTGRSEGRTPSRSEGAPAPSRKPQGLQSLMNKRPHRG